MTTYTFKMLVWPQTLDTVSGTTELIANDGDPDVIQIHLITLRNKGVVRRRIYLYLIPNGTSPLNEPFADFYLDPNETLFVEFEGSKALVLGTSGDTFHAAADGANDVVITVKGCEISNS